MKIFSAYIVAAVSGLSVLATNLPAASCCAAPAPAAEAGAAASSLPDESIYHLDAQWQDQDGRQVALADLAGQPVVLTMIFTHCAYACPRIVVDVQAIRAALPVSIRDEARFVLASFDTARDTPERLRAWADQQELDGQWTLLHGDAAAVRELSVLLDIPYLPQPDGGFGHGNRIVLLDRTGVIVADVEGLGAAPAPIVDAAAKLTR